jgi:hypothetical protein
VPRYRTQTREPGRQHRYATRKPWGARSGPRADEKPGLDVGKLIELIEAPMSYRAIKKSLGTTSKELHTTISRLRKNGLDWIPPAKEQAAWADMVNATLTDEQRRSIDARATANGIDTAINRLASRGKL